eukprot:1119104-Amphidinium_carterae.1
MFGSFCGVLETLSGLGHSNTRFKHVRLFVFDLLRPKSPSPHTEHRKSTQPRTTSNLRSAKLGYCVSVRAATAATT